MAGSTSGLTMPERKTSLRERPFENA
jgi:hypothetical protein